MVGENNDQDTSNVAPLVAGAGLGAVGAGATWHYTKKQAEEQKQVNANERVVNAQIAEEQKDMDVLRKDLLEKFPEKYTKHLPPEASFAGLAEGLTSATQALDKDIAAATAAKDKLQQAIDKKGLRGKLPKHDASNPHSIDLGLEDMEHTAQSALKVKAALGENSRAAEDYGVAATRLGEDIDAYADDVKNGLDTIKKKIQATAEQLASDYGISVKKPLLQFKDKELSCDDLVAAIDKQLEKQGNGDNILLEKLKRDAENMQQSLNLDKLLWETQRRDDVASIIDAHNIPEDLLQKFQEAQWHVAECNAKIEEFHAENSMVDWLDKEPADALGQLMEEREAVYQDLENSLKLKQDELLPLFKKARNELPKNLRNALKNAIDPQGLVDGEIERLQEAMKEPAALVQIKSDLQNVASEHSGLLAKSGAIQAIRNGKPVDGFLESMDATARQEIVSLRNDMAANSAAIERLQGEGEALEQLQLLLGKGEHAPLAELQKCKTGFAGLEASARDVLASGATSEVDRLIHKPMHAPREYKIPQDAPEKRQLELKEANAAEEKIYELNQNFHKLKKQLSAGAEYAGQLKTAELELKAAVMPHITKLHGMEDAVEAALKAVEETAENASKGGSAGKMAMVGAATALLGTVLADKLFNHRKRHSPEVSHTTRLEMEAQQRTALLQGQRGPTV